MSDINKKVPSRNNNQNNQKRKSAGKSTKPMTLGNLILRCIVLLVVPYAYLFLCGLIFDTWLNWYNAVSFIFYSLITFYIINIVLMVLTIIKFVKQRRHAKKPVRKD